MICIAAFIILGIIVLCLPVIRFFSQKTSDNIWHLFQKSVHCFSRRVTLRKCDTSFKDDIKNSILRRTVLRHPKWTKPLSVAIEIGAILIILITIWSLLVAARSLTMLVGYGTCDPASPKSCALSSSSSVKACPVNQSDGTDFWKNPLGWIDDWFGQWGAAFGQIPARLKHWRATDYLPKPVAQNQFYNQYDPRKPVALDILDPGCTYCRIEFNNQLNSGFLDKNNVALMLYVKPGDKDGYEFENSYVIASYVEAVRQRPLGSAQMRPKDEAHPAAWLLIKRLFTERDPMTNHLWQDTFGSLDSNTYGSFGRLFTRSQARSELNEWLGDFGYTSKQVSEIATLANSDQIKKAIAGNMRIVDDKIQAQSLPTVITDGSRKSGLQGN